MVRRAIPLLLAAACAFDSSGQSGSADADGTSPGPSTTIMPSDGTSIASDVSNDGTQSDSSVTLDATTQGDSSITVDPTVSDATDVTDSTTEPTGDPTDATETTRGPTDESTTDPTRGDSSSGGGDDEEVCDGLDNDGDGGIDEGSPSNLACDACIFLPATAGPFYFAICTPPMMWDLGRLRCADFGPGGDLAKIENAVDQDALLDLIDEDHWMGIEDMQTDGLWFWVDGTQARTPGMVFGYDGWGLNQPDGELAENCAELDAGQAGWADSSCEQLQPIVCRHDM